jgi:Recombinase
MTTCPCGTRSLRAIADELNARGIQTPRGVGQWQAGSVSQLLARL